MTAPPNDPPFIVRVRGAIPGEAADDLVADLAGQGWECSPVRRPKHGDPEFVIALAGLAMAGTRLVRALPPTLREWNRRHRLRECEVILERGGREITRIAIATDSDGDHADAVAAAVSEMVRDAGDRA